MAILTCPFSERGRSFHLSIMILTLPIKSERFNLKRSFGFLVILIPMVKPESCPKFFIRLKSGLRDNLTDNKVRITSSAYKPIGLSDVP